MLGAVLGFQKKILGPAGPQVFIFGRQFTQRRKSPILGARLATRRENLVATEKKLVALATPRVATSSPVGDLASLNSLFVAIPNMKVMLDIPSQ